MNKLNPSSWFSVAPGTDSAIVSREEIRAYQFAVAEASPHVHHATLGTSTEGKPLDALVVGDAIRDSPFDMVAGSRLEEVHSLLSPSPRSGTHWRTPVVLITAGIHATELGPPQAIPELLHWLAFSDDDGAALVRERLVTIIVPTLNPDGMDLVHRWHERTLHTELEGSKPPLLYQRFAGHDNNRDWLFRNLVETRLLLDHIHDRWLPHVTLDQHQMNPTGPRFYLPPYADPWDPNVHSSIIAAGSALGQSVASALTLRGMAGVTTSRYFDAWEPSRALQHYRGGVRILAEAASANVACPITIDRSQLSEPPFALDQHGTSSTPMPWEGGTWRLRDIMDYHLEAAKSLLRVISTDPETWLAVQEQSLKPPVTDAFAINVPYTAASGDMAANHRLHQILDEAGATENQGATDGGWTYSFDQPQQALLRSTLLATEYPLHDGHRPYDLTTHHLPLFLGAYVEDTTVRDQRDQRASVSSTGDGDYLVINANCHTAPNMIEDALRQHRRVWRSPRRQLQREWLIEPGSWIVESPVQVRAPEFQRLEMLPAGCRQVNRKAILLLSTTDSPSADHGWTRWWLHARDIPFLEMHVRHFDQINVHTGSTTCLIADADVDTFDERTLEKLTTFAYNGGTLIAFGATGRALAAHVSTGISVVDASSNPDMHAPGALLRLVIDRRTPFGVGLDRAVPALFENDGAFEVSPGADNITVLARFAQHNPLVSGWMQGVDLIANRAGVVQCRVGTGTLYAFSFKPLFRGQMLVTSPLVHNLIYSESG